MTQKYTTRTERKQATKKKPTKRKNNSKKNNSSLWRKVLVAFLSAGIAVLLIGIIVFAYFISDAPELDEALLFNPVPSKVYDMNGEYVADIGSTRLDYVEYKDIPEVVENAIIATEDSRFYKHNGLDIRRLAAAVIANFTDGFGSQGASTITQQVVKNSFLTNEKTIKRKAQELWLAFQLERKYSKEEIFEMYVNKVWMENRSYGMKTAARVYLGKDLSEVTLPEAAMLAGIPQSPYNYNPFKFPEKAEKRKDTVLHLMNLHGYITEEEMKAAQEVEVSSFILPEDQRVQSTEPYDAFIDLVKDEVNQRYPDVDLSADGLKIYTTLDTSAQEYVNAVLDTEEYINYPDDKFQVGLTLMDTQTGEIRAVGGGRNMASGGFNYAQDTQRPSGSTFKPIFDYAPAVEFLNWGTYKLLDDNEHTYSNGTAIKNWDNKYMGVMSAREALARSRNIPALKTLQAVGLDNAKSFANRLGFNITKNNESYALGTYNVSPIQMTAAYAAFGNGGTYNKPRTVTAIDFGDGNVIKMSSSSSVAMKDSTAYIVTSMLKSVMKDSYGTGRTANVSNLDVAGKTGTTNYSAEAYEKWDIPSGGVPDIWFVGYTTDYSLGIWTGYPEQSTAIKKADQKIAQKIFKQIMTKVSKGKNTPNFKMPSSVQKVSIEKGTELLASEYTPEDQITTEYAVKGHAPTEVSTAYDKPSAIEKLQSFFNDLLDQIEIKWDYDTSSFKEGDSLTFEVSQSIDEAPSTVLDVTTFNEYIISNPIPGAIYNFTVTAIVNDLKSDPVSTKITIPAVTLPPENEDNDEVIDEGNSDDLIDGVLDGETNENNDSNDAVEDEIVPPTEDTPEIP